MSPVGHALHDRFERVCRNELQRLRRKTASLTDSERAQVDALALEVTRRLAVSLDAAVAAPGRSGMASVVMRLFAVVPPSDKESQCG
jgi:hypothetical protein